MTTDKTIYLRMKYKIDASPNKTITINHVAQLIGDETVVETIGSMPVYQLQMNDHHMAVIESTDVLRTIFRRYSNLDIELVGPQATLVNIRYKKYPFRPVLFLFTWLLLFIGSGVAIMNFHEDVSMQAVHQKLYYLITGKNETYPLLLQIPYSFGLGAGMIVFFNHVFKKRLNEEPSPLEVEMFNYQQDLDRYVLYEQRSKTEKIPDAD